jgi:hypothetical protein
VRVGGGGAGEVGRDGRRAGGGGASGVGMGCFEEMASWVLGWGISIVCMVTCKSII